MGRGLFDREGLIGAIRERFVLDWEGIHGWDHWMRVHETGLALAADVGGADVQVLELFSLLHDSCRESDGFDREHGPRAALFARTLHNVFFNLEEAALDLLLLAIEDHTMGYVHRDPTVRVCWDADRLDLPRVGTVPKARFFGTKAARMILESRAEGGPR